MTRNAATPEVGVIMGSDSDLPTMIHAVRTLQLFNITVETSIVSAHRTPEWMAQYASDAEGRGVEVIIAGAGGSAHLPGMVASETTLPVLGVAIESQPDPTNAALGSMVRMPEGAPLATMGKNKAAAVNAGLFAVRILALQDSGLRHLYKQYVSNMKADVGAKDALLLSAGPEAYLAQMKERG